MECFLTNCKSLSVSFKARHKNVVFLVHLLFVFLFVCALRNRLMTVHPCPCLAPLAQAGYLIKPFSLLSRAVSVSPKRKHGTVQNHGV